MSLSLGTKTILLFFVAFSNIIISHGIFYIAAVVVVVIIAAVSSLYHFDLESSTNVHIVVMCARLILLIQERVSS